MCNIWVITLRADEQPITGDLVRSESENICDAVTNEQNRERNDVVANCRQNTTTLSGSHRETSITWVKFSIPSCTTHYIIILLLHIIHTKIFLDIFWSSHNQSTFYRTKFHNVKYYKYRFAIDGIIKMISASTPRQCEPPQSTNAFLKHIIHLLRSSEYQCCLRIFPHITNGPILVDNFKMSLVKFNPNRAHGILQKHRILQDDYQNEASDDFPRVKHI